MDEVESANNTRFQLLLEDNFIYKYHPVKKKIFTTHGGGVAPFRFSMKAQTHGKTISKIMSPTAFIILVIFSIIMIQKISIH